MVFQLCGSGINADCLMIDGKTKAQSKIQCCYNDALLIDNNKCFWKYGASGSHQTCEKGYVLTGVCGGGRDPSKRCSCCHLK